MAAISLCFCSTAIAADIQWDFGAATTDWTNPINWAGDVLPGGGDNAIVNVTTDFPVVNNAPQGASEIWLGEGAGTNGRVDLVTGGTLTANNWTAIGRNGGSGTLNMSGGTFNSGGGSFIIGAGGGTNGTLNMTGGTINSTGQFWVSENGTGTADVTSGTITAGQEVNIGRNDGGNGTMTLNVGSSITNTTGNFIIANKNGQGGTTTGSLTLNAGAVVNVVAGEFWVGQGGGANGTLTQNGGDITTNNWTVIAREGATGTYNMNGGTLTKSGGGQFIVGDRGIATVNQTEGTISSGDDELWVGQGSMASTYFMTGGTLNVNNFIAVGRQGGTGNFIQTGGTINKTGPGELVIGAGVNNADPVNPVSGTGTFTASGGVLNVNNAIEVGEDNATSTSTLSISGTAQVSSLSVIVANGGAAGTGIFDITGGTLTTGQIIGGPGTSTASFGGGQIVATADSAAFISSLTSATLNSGGLRVNSNGFTLTAPQSFSGIGGVIKTGAGTLNLSGSNSYSGTTNVDAGILGGSGSSPSGFFVAAGAELNPGVSTGVLTAASVSIAASASLGIDILDSGADRLDVSGNLSISGATLDLSGTPTSRVYVIANFGSRTGTFLPPALPPGYTLNYTANQITLTRPANAFDNFIDPIFPGNPNDPAFVGPNADPDGDGNSNRVEFALGGDPASGSDNAKVYVLIADSSDAGTAPELLMTIAVRNGTPAFTGSPSPTATQSGATYTIQGSLDLATFTSPVTPVNPVTTGLPSAPSGYNYRTFSLDGSNGTPTRGFMRVCVTP